MICLTKQKKIITCQLTDIKERRYTMKNTEKKPIHFEFYGELEWLEPEDYYKGPWTYVCSSYISEGDYDLVRNKTTMEMRYTNI